MFLEVFVIIYFEIIKGRFRIYSINVGNVEMFLLRIFYFVCYNFKKVFK